MTHQHEILPVEDLGTTNSGTARHADNNVDVDVDVDLASQPLPLVLPAAEPMPVAPAAPNAKPNSAEFASDEALERWKVIQGNFVDDPRGAVVEARSLVDDLVQRIVRDLTQHRESLDQQWASEASTSTEQLRVCLQHYRAFLSRILPALSATTQADPR